MKKQLLTLGLMLAVCGAYAQGTRVEALTGLNNTSFYTIKSQDRGYLFYDSNNPDYVTSTTSGKPNNGITNDTPTNEATATTEQFAFLRGDYTAAGQYYLYSRAAQKFVSYNADPDVKLTLTDEPLCTWTVEHNLNNDAHFFTIKVPGTTNRYINVTNYNDHLGCKVFGTGVDEGNRMAVTNVVTAEDEATAALKKVKIKEGKALMGVGVGYPKTTSAAYTTLDGISTENTLEEITTAVSNSFRIKSANQCKATGLTDANLIGKVCLQCYYTKSGFVGFHHLMYSFSTKKYHRAGAESVYYGDNAHTIYYTLEEVPAEDYTTNVLNVNANAELDGEYLATYFAPYATKLGEGYKAYTINAVDNENHKALLTELETDIPANTGVIITAPAAGKVTLTLSTANPAAVEDNKLEGSVGVAYLAADNAYVLGKGDNGVGLYRPESNKNADGTAGSGYFKNNAGRAYLNVEGVAAPSLVFSFGGVETAIGAVREQSANTTAIYDLSGRRVKRATKGIFIMGGKKVIK